MTTLKDVANACGVSVASVSKALNNAPDIGQETAKMIRETAEKLGYRPNAAARALKTNRTYNIGVLFEDETHAGLAHEYFSSVLDAVKNGVESRGYDVTFISHNMGSTRMSFLEHCRYRNVDGVVIANVDFSDPAVKELVQSDIPVVTIDFVFENKNAVISDNVQGMRDLTQYIISAGHRKIAFVHGEDTAVTMYRVQGFKDICAENGISIPQEYLIKTRYHDPKQSGIATRALLKLPERPTCIIYPDDISILGGITEIESSGLRIPEDISVAGYDGIRMSQLFRPRITTLRQDSEALGSKAAELLINEIENSKSSMPVYIPGTVCAGETVAVCAE